MKTLFKKFLVLCAVFAAVSAVVPASPAFAESFSGSCRDFLGLTSWDCGVNIDSEESLQSGIWTIVANVVADVTIIASYLVVGYVIYGGYLYIFSSGDPGKVATAKKTLSQAFIGLAIAMSATVIMSSIRIALVGENHNLGECVQGIDGCGGANDMIYNLIHWVIRVVGIVAAIFVVYGGISYTTSAGDPSKLQKAKQMITYALIGLAIVALAEVITAFVSGMIRDANNAAATYHIDTINITKEIS